MQTLNSAVRIRAEGSAVIVKSVATVAVLVYDSYGSRQKGQGHLALLAFGIGQLAYSICLLLVYSSEYGSSVSYKLRKPKAEKPQSKRCATVIIVLEMCLDVMKLQFSVAELL